MAANLPKMAGQFAMHPVVNALGVFDAATNQVEIGTLYKPAVPYNGTLTGS